MYSLLYMVNKNRLPWKNIDYDRNLKMKEITDIDLMICSNDAKPFKSLYKYIYRLQYDEEPNYNKIRFLFQKIIMKTDKAPSQKNLDWIMEVR